MEPVGIWLLSVGLGDVIAGYSGEVASRARGWWAWGIGSATAPALAWLAGFGWGAASLLGAWSIVTLGVWLWARLPEVWSSRRAAAILAGVAGAVLAFAVSGAQWPNARGGTIERVLDDLPYPVLSGQSQGRVLTVLGALLFLQASANALVRLLLAVVGTPEADQSLRGGRFIGPMERTLIFGLGVAGYLTAAAVVATAKGLLRFPEISKETERTSTPLPSTSWSDPWRAGSSPWPHWRSFRPSGPEVNGDPAQVLGTGCRIGEPCVPMGPRTFR